VYLLRVIIFLGRRLPTVAEGCRVKKVILKLITNHLNTPTWPTKKTTAAWYEIISPIEKPTPKGRRLWCATIVL
jgi:hypothetical protein